MKDKSILFSVVAFLFVIFGAVMSFVIKNPIVPTSAFFVATLSLCVACFYGALGQYSASDREEDYRNNDDRFNEIWRSIDKNNELHVNAHKQIHDRISNDIEKIHETIDRNHEKINDRISDDYISLQHDIEEITRRIHECRANCSVGKK